MKRFFYFLIFSLFIQCSSINKNGGIIFTFDDQYIAEWVEYVDLFEKYDVYATFFISRPHLLDSTQINGLYTLRDRGHEIGCHSLNHLDPLTYKDSVNDYYSDEVEPAIRILDSLGFDIKSYAYPFGNSPDPIDSLMLDHLEYIRKATWNKNNTTINTCNEIYASKDNYKVINSMGIDYNYNITLENLKTGIKRAKKNNEILLLHAHKIDTSLMDYTIHPDYLEEVFNLCRKNNIHAIRMRDIKNYFYEK
jgi:peptidoglycan/xylan/chitin deacetylase (PgdA/CDA1 family)